jgi:hypothetical protein
MKFIDLDVVASDSTLRTALLCVCVKTKSNSNAQYVSDMASSKPGFFLEVTSNSRKGRVLHLVAPSLLISL